MGTAIVHAFVTPYVVQMRMIKGKDALIEADIPLKFLKNYQKEPEEKTSGDETNKEGSTESVKEETKTGEENGEEKEGEEEELDEDDDNEIEFFDLKDCKVEITTLNLFGMQQKLVTDLNEIRLASNFLGTANFVTKEKKQIFIHEDQISAEGHPWFIQHVQNHQASQKILKDFEPKTTEEDKDPLF